MEETREFLLSQLTEELEPWKPAHVEAMACCDFEDLLRKHMRQFQWIRLIDDGWSRRVESGAAPFEPQAAKLIRGFYDAWYEPCDELLVQLEKWERDFPDFKGGNEFRQARHQVMSILRVPLELLLESEQEVDAARTNR